MNAGDLVFALQLNDVKTLLGRIYVLQHVEQDLKELGETALVNKLNFNYYFFMSSSSLNFMSRK